MKKAFERNEELGEKSSLSQAFDINSISPMFSERNNVQWLLLDFKAVDSTEFYS